MSGLPWIKVHINLPRHDKAIRLAARLEDSRAWTWVVQLWFWAAEHRPDGLVECPDAELVIAYGAGWKGDADTFVRHLVACGFLDKTPAGYAVHDWSEYAGAHVEKRRKDTDRKRKSRGSHADIPVTSAPVPRESAREMEKERETVVPPLAKLPGRDDVLAQKYPATQAVIDALRARGLVMAHATQPERRQAVEDVCASLAVEAAADAVEASLEVKRKAWIGWHLEALSAAASRPRSAPDDLLDESWLPPGSDANLWRTIRGNIFADFPAEAPQRIARARAQFLERFAS